jgi:hypothetical protein
MKLMEGENNFGKKYQGGGINIILTPHPDIVLFNGKSVCIVETKYKGRKDNLPKVIRKAETFRATYPDYAKHKIYLGLSALVFDDEIEQECIRKGIAIIKQVGDTVVINDKNIKVFKK